MRGSSTGCVVVPTLIRSNTYTPGLAHAIDLRGRWRSPLIAQDLLALGWKPVEVTHLRCHSVEPFHEVADALGWMYVVERATLFHGDVRDELVDRSPDLWPACAYLSAHQRSAHRRWLELGIAIDHFCTSRRLGERLVAAARDAFASLREWERASVPLLRSVG